MNGLIEFLNQYSERKLGEEKKETTFNGEYSKFGIMIVGKSAKISREGATPYKTHIESLIQKGVETIYLIGNSKKQGFVKNVCDEDFLKICNLSILNNRKYFAVIKDKTNKKMESETYLTVLRRNNINHYFTEK